jgi:hypothetical protein
MVLTGARVSAQAQGGQVLVSGTVRDLVAGSGLHVVDEGAHCLKGISDEVRAFSVANEMGESEYEDVRRNWFATYFPGAQVRPLDGMGAVPRKGKPGWPRLHESNAEKTSAHRKKPQEWLIQLDLVNGTSLAIGRYPDLACEVGLR